MAKASNETIIVKKEDIVILPPEREKVIVEKIETSLVKENVTEKAIARLEKEFVELKIKGPDDKEGYLAVSAARKECKKFRVVITKICKAGRAEANAEAKMWVNKENDLSGRVGAIEDVLEADEKAYEAANALKKQQEASKQEQQRIERTSHMVSFGARVEENNWVLGPVSYETVLVSQSDPEIYQDIYSQFEAQFKVNESDRIEKENKRHEEQEELRRQQQKLENDRIELARQQEEIRLQKEENERQEKKRKEEALQALFVKRQQELKELGMAFDPFTDYFTGYGVKMNLIFFKDHLELEQEKWDNVIERITIDLEKGKEEARIKEEELARIGEEKRLQDIRDASDRATGAARNKSLRQLGWDKTQDDRTTGKMSEEDWDHFYGEAKDFYEKEQKKVSDQKEAEENERLRLQKEKELAEAGDKVKYADTVKHILATPIHEMRSSQYRIKMKTIRDFVESLK